MSGLRGEIPDSVEDGLGELVQSSPLQSPVEDLANVSAGPPKLDVILIIDHRVLERRR